MQVDLLEFSQVQHDVESSQAQLSRSKFNSFQLFCRMQKEKVQLQLRSSASEIRKTLAELWKERVKQSEKQLYSNLAAELKTRSPQHDENNGSEAKRKRPRDPLAESISEDIEASPSNKKQRSEAIGQSTATHPEEQVLDPIGGRRRSSRRSSICPKELIPKVNRKRLIEDDEEDKEDERRKVSCNSDEIKMVAGVVRPPKEMQKTRSKFLLPDIQLQQYNRAIHGFDREKEAASALSIWQKKRVGSACSSSHKDNIKVFERNTKRLGLIPGALQNKRRMELASLRSLDDDQFLFECDKHNSSFNGLLENYLSRSGQNLLMLLVQDKQKISRKYSSARDRFAERSERKSRKIEKLERTVHRLETELDEAETDRRKTREEQHKKYEHLKEERRDLLDDYDRRKRQIYELKNTNLRLEESLKQVNYQLQKQQREWPQDHSLKSKPQLQSHSAFQKFATITSPFKRVANFSENGGFLARKEVSDPAISSKWGSSAESTFVQHTPSVLISRSTTNSSSEKVSNLSEVVKSQEEVEKEVASLCQLICRKLSISLPSSSLSAQSSENGSNAESSESAPFSPRSNMPGIFHSITRESRYDLLLPKSKVSVASHAWSVPSPHSI